MIGSHKLVWTATASYGGMEGQGMVMEVDSWVLCDACQHCKDPRIRAVQTRFSSRCWEWMPSRMMSTWEIGSLAIRPVDLLRQYIYEAASSLGLFSSLDLVQCLVFAQLVLAG